MKWNVQRAAVLGAGTMGSRIAAHLANCGIRSYLLDIVPTELTPEEKKKGLQLSSPAVRNRVARNGLDAALKGRPAALSIDDLAAFITPGNFEDDMPKVAEADWIIEAVTENLGVKRAMLQRVAPFRKAGAVISSNTSGLPIARIAEGFPEEFRRHWLGTHFFNPPRYLHLLEVIPGPDTLPEIVEAVSQFADLRLGKGVVRAKDTPNFIANRIGVFSTCNILRIAQEENLTVEEVDRLTGPALGWPKSATFGTLDLVGLDVLDLVARNLVENAPGDESLEIFRVPEFVTKMMSSGLLGAKTGSGFYKRPKSGSGDTQVLDLQTVEYRVQEKPEFPSLDLAKGIDDVRQRVRMLFECNDRAGHLLWKAIGPVLAYAARRIPEIADRVVEVDRAMKWGFGWELGPFEMWDAIGVEKSVGRMRREGLNVPENVQRMLSSRYTSFYDESGRERRYFDFGSGEYKSVEPLPGVLLLHDGHGAPRVVRRETDASLLDLGDGIACVEFHSKMNAIGPEGVAMLNAGLGELAESFDALVIANQGVNFSAGANLLLLLMQIRDSNWEDIDREVRTFQKMTLGIKYSPKPVVAAPFKMVLGGGCEVALAAPRLRASAETYMGLVEAGVGLVPAGGGVKEMLLRCTEALPAGEELLPAIKEAFNLISRARVSGSAEEARRLRFLRPSDSVTMNPHHLVADAKQTALEMASDGYRAPSPGPRSDIRVAGQAALAELKIGIHIARRGEFITGHDALIAGKIAHILCGGNLTGSSLVTEQYLMDLEREAFLSLCGEPNTQARIEHMLKTGKPLRN
ncbi:MAG: 3-hydroxyacyl-CoA dehydrogenase/enoyl-CoA hydratase family protein [Acidobacteria bacterium]|nr:3-hydroxyacyl-CoA dehydrogenase/enoyl-CoA hydratase family protein [Acidobacteriota bacterium]